MTDAGIETPTARTVGSLRRVFAFEWRLLRAERAWGVVALLALAVGFAAAHGRSWTAFQQRAILDARAEESARLVALARTLDSVSRDTSTVAPWGDPRYPYTAAQVQARRYAILPPAPLAPLAVGQSDLFPSYFRVGLTSRETFLVNDETVNPAHLAAGPFDLSFVVVLLYPLVVLALGYNLLSAEREAGTLPLLLSQPVALRTVLLGKVALRAAAVVAIAVGLTLGGALVAGVSLGAPGALAAAGAWVAITVAYGLFWLALALLVNVYGGSSATNALALVGTWLAFAVLVPALLNLGVTTLHPAPSRVELMQATREASNAASAKGSAALGVYFQDHPELMRGGTPDVGDFATQTVATAEMVTRAVQPVTQRFEVEIDAQQRLVDRWQWLSPALVTQLALTDLAGTETGRYRDFQRQVDRYSDTLRAFYVPRITRRARFGVADVSAVPAFRYAPPRPRQSGMVATVVLLAGAGLLTWVALRRARRVTAAMA